MLAVQPYREYLYDRFGNLAGVNQGGRKADPSTVTVSYPTSTVNNQLEPPAAAYDATGRLTNYSSTAYGWDVLDQMTKVDGTAAGSEAWIHIYNSGGERVWSWRASGSRQDNYTVRDASGKVLTLFTKLPGSPIATYTWEDYIYREGQLLAAKVSTGAVKHFDLDHLGSVRLETDSAGAVLAYREFWPYGEEVTLPAGTERMKFTGHERDLGVLGSNVDDLDYMHARYYRPLVGRFLSLDPGPVDASHPQTWNRYTYALDNPLYYIDTDGEVISLASLTQEQRDRLPAQLADFTGNIYGTDKDGNLTLVNVGSGSSLTATSFLNDEIDSTTVYPVVATAGKTRGNSEAGQIEINFTSFEDIKYGKVTPATSTWALLLFTIYTMQPVDFKIWTTVLAVSLRVGRAQS